MCFIKFLLLAVISISAASFTGAEFNVHDETAYVVDPSTGEPEEEESEEVAV